MKLMHNQENQSKRLDDKVAWSRLFCQIKGIDRVKTNEQPPRLANSFELIIVKEGKGLIRLDQASFFLHAQDVCFIHPSQVYSVETKHDESLEYICCRFEVFTVGREGLELTSFREHHLFPLKGKQSVGEFPEILETVESLYHFKESGKGLERFHKRILLEQLIYLIAKNRKTSSEKDTLKAIEETRVFMENHFHENISIGMLASKAEISAKYFSDLFKKEYGISVSEYLTNLRINKAKSLLVKGEEKIRDIANQVGYSDEFYLSRKFKQTVGISPSIYRKRRKQKVAAYDLPTIGHLYALNICPYAAPIHPKWTSYYYQTHRHEISVHLSAFQINKDWKANLQILEKNPPDLIISRDGISKEEKEQLSNIAPVYFYPQKISWREQLLSIAKYLGEWQEAKEWLKTYERKVMHTRNRMKTYVGAETFLPLRLYRGLLYLDYTRTIKEVFFGDLQMNAYPLNDGKPRKRVIFLSELARCNPDRLLLNICQESATIESWSSLQQERLWNDLNAVRFHQVYTISSDPWREYSSSSHKRVLEETIALFTGCSENQKNGSSLPF